MMYLVGVIIFSFSFLRKAWADDTIISEPTFVIKEIQTHREAIGSVEFRWTEENASAITGNVAFPLFYERGPRLIPGSRAQVTPDGYLRLEKNVTTFLEQGSPFLDGVHIRGVNSIQYLDPMVIEYRVKVEGTSSRATANETKSMAHMRICQRSEITCDYTYTLAEVYFDSDGFIKLDNGYGSAPISCGAWSPEIWITLQLYIDWNKDSLNVVLLRYHADSDSFVQVGALSSTPVSYFASIYLYNGGVQGVSYFDYIRFFDVSSFLVQITAGGVPLNASNVNLAVTLGSNEKMPVEPTLDACSTNVSRYSAGISIIKGASASLTVFNNSIFKAYACINSSLVNTTNENVRYTSIATSISYMVASEPPVVIPSKNNDFVPGTNGNMAYDSFDVNVFAQYPNVKYISITDSNPPEDPISCFGSSEGICNSKKCYGFYRQSCTFGSYISSDELTLFPTPVSTKSFEPTSSPTRSPFPTLTGFNREELSLRTFCFRRNTYLLALSIEVGKLPSRVTMSSQYTVKLPSPEVNILSDGMWPQWIRKMALWQSLGLYIDHVLVFINARSSGAYMVWSVGDGTQDGLTAENENDNILSKVDPSWRLACKLPPNIDKISWPKRGIISPPLNQSRSTIDDKCISSVSLESSLSAVKRLDGDAANSIHVISCREGNEPSDSSKIFVYIMSGYELLTALLAGVFAITFTIWYFVGIFQIKRRISRARRFLCPNPYTAPQGNLQQDYESQKPLMDDGKNEEKKENADAEESKSPFMAALGDEIDDID